MTGGLKKHRISRKMILISLSVLLLVIIGCTVAWVMWSNALRGHYNAQTGSFKAQATEQLMQRVASLKDAQGSTNTREVLMSLAETAGTLDEKLPLEPTILGIAVVAKDAKLQQQQITDKANALAAEITKSQEVLVYQEKVVAVLKDVRVKTGKNLDELRALPGAWQAAIDAIKPVQPPEQASAFHASVLTSLESIKATLDTLPALYEKKDTSGFAAKQKELDSKIAGLKELSHTLDDIATKQDTQLSGLYWELRKLLQ